MKTLFLLVLVIFTFKDLSFAQIATNELVGYYSYFRDANNPPDNSNNGILQKDSKYTVDWFGIANSSAQLVDQNLDSIIFEKINQATGQFYISGKKKYVHNSNGNLIHYVFMEWDNIISKWVGIYNYEYSYNLSGNMTLSKHYEWDKNALKWGGYFKKTEFTYDSEERGIKELYYSWDESANNWFCYQKTEYHYDSRGI